MPLSARREWAEDSGDQADLMSLLAQGISREQRALVENTLRPLLTNRSYWRGVFNAEGKLDVELEVTQTSNIEPQYPFPGAQEPIAEDIVDCIASLHRFPPLTYLSSTARARDAPPREHFTFTDKDGGKAVASTIIDFYQHTDNFLPLVDFLAAVRALIALVNQAALSRLEAIERIWTRSSAHERADRGRTQALHGPASSVFVGCAHRGGNGRALDDLRQVTRSSQSRKRLPTDLRLNGTAHGLPLALRPQEAQDRLDGAHCDGPTVIWRFRGTSEVLLFDRRLHQPKAGV